MEASKSRTLFMVNLLGLLTVIIVNALANTLPINGMNTGQISDLYPNYFVPAGFTFSIWGLIYLLLTAFVIYHFYGLTKRDEDINAAYLKIGYNFAATCMLNISWILLWHYLQIELSLLVMVCFLLVLIQIYRATQLLPDTKGIYGFVKVPFHVYLGWISVATIANATAVFVHVDVDFLMTNQLVFTQIGFLTAIILALIMVIKERSYAFGLVVIWALYGIHYKLGVANTTMPSLKSIAFYGMIAITIALIVRLGLSLKKT